MPSRGRAALPRPVGSWTILRCASSSSACRRTSIPRTGGGRAGPRRNPSRLATLPAVRQRDDRMRARDRPRPVARGPRRPRARRNRGRPRADRGRRGTRRSTGAAAESRRRSRRDVPAGRRACAGARTAQPAARRRAPRPVRRLRWQPSLAREPVRADPRARPGTATGAGGRANLERAQPGAGATLGVETVPWDGFDVDRVPIPDAPLYVTIDLDGLDPAFAPGVSHPSPAV